MTNCLCDGCEMRRKELALVMTLEVEYRACLRQRLRALEMEQAGQ